MTHVTCRLTARNRDQPRNPTLGNRVWATFYGHKLVSPLHCDTLYAMHVMRPKISEERRSRWRRRQRWRTQWSRLDPEQWSARSIHSGLIRQVPPPRLIYRHLANVWERQPVVWSITWQLVLMTTKDSWQHVDKHLHYITFNSWRTVVSGTWKYDDPRLKMSHEGALCVICFVVWPTARIL